jgi:DNA polymerase III alpha subunit (gram-positive type)
VTDTTQSAPTILILDVATTGFSPKGDAILEIACILLDAGTLDVIDTCTHVIKHDVSVLDRKVPDFHEALLLECIEGEHAQDIRVVEGLLLAGPWLSARVIVNRNLEFFDMKFLAEHMPTFHKQLARKLTLDLRVLEVLYGSIGLPAYESKHPKTFRAGDEVINAYEEFSYFRGFAAALTVTQ